MNRFVQAHVFKSTRLSSRSDLSLALYHVQMMALTHAKLKLDSKPSPEELLLGLFEHFRNHLEMSSQDFHFVFIGFHTIKHFLCDLYRNSMVIRGCGHACSHWVHHALCSH